MSEDRGKRHIIPCRHRGFYKRIYVVWKGDGDGKVELDSAMQGFGRAEYDPDASPSDHFKGIADYLRGRGFKMIKA